MNKLFKKKYLLIVTAVILLTLVVGCSGEGDLIGDEDEYDLNVGVALEEVAGENIEAITDQIEADSAEITVTNNDDSSDVHRDNSSIENDEVVFEISGLANENSYEIEVDIYEEDEDSEEEFKIYQGSDEVLIDGEDTTASIDVELTDAEAVVFSLENLPPLPSETDNAIIEFVPRNEYDIEEEINFADDNTEGEAIVEGLAANHYHFTILFIDEDGDEKELEGEEKDNWEVDDNEFYAYPGARTTVVNLDFNYDGGDPGEGSLDIDIGWELPPEVPETINVENNVEDVELSWEDTSDSYFLYRGQSADELSPIERDTISGTEYTDEDVEAGETYYYSIRAYDENNLASSKSDVVSVTVDEEETDFDGVRIYYKSDYTPNIWIWEANEGVPITEEMGYEWDEQPEMEATEDDGWYVFEIPTEGENDEGEEIEFLTGEDLNLILDENDENELEIEPETAWYDGSEWHEENPDGPSKPAVDITPGEGSYAGDTEISVEINDDDTSNIEFDGQTVGNNFELEDYLADGESGELVVEAENDIGTREVSQEYTRDDEAGDDLPSIPESEVNETMYQAFYWETYEGLWSDIADEEYENVDAERLAEAGITSMWLPPAAKAGEGEDSMGYDVYDFWDLGEFDQQGAQNTHWGTRDELESALGQLDDLGIDAYFDVVFNHRMGGEIEEVPLNDGGTARPYTDFTLEGRAEHYSNADEFDWNWEEFNGADWCSESDYHPDGAEDRGGFIDPNWDDTDDEGNPQSGNAALFQGKDWQGDEIYSSYYLMGNDVDYAQERVRDEMDEWGEWITEEVGFAGFRMDAIAHVPDYFTDQWIDHVQENTEDDIFFVAEAWVGNVDNYLDSVDNDDLMAFDFSLRDEFVEMSDGDKDLSYWGGLINSHHAEQAVTFIDNHDTSRAGNPYGQPQVENFKNQAYAYILMREEGVPTVYARDYDEFGMADNLDKMIEARRYFAYGAGHEVDNNDYHTYSYVREGLDNVDGTGLVMMISDSRNGGSTTKSINSRQPNTEFYDYTGNVDGTVTTDSNGYGDFQVREEESNGWSIWVPKN